MSFVHDSIKLNRVCVGKKFEMTRLYLKVLRLLIVVLTIHICSIEKKRLAELPAATVGFNDRLKDSA